jgi:hypothetical protein
MSRLSRSTRKRKVGLGAVVLTGLGTQACGPNIQFIYEGQIRFEHCYRLDFDQNIVQSHRKACWEDWRARYTKGQTKDRVEYAQRRIDALANGEQVTLTLPAPSASDAGNRPLVSKQTAPVPTNPHLPPPAKLETPLTPTSAASAKP